MSVKNLPQIRDLRQHVDYNPDTGILSWRIGPSQIAKSGMRAFACSHRMGYLQGKFMGRSLLAHRVAWAVHHGSWPDDKIDHINGDKYDNRIANLRQCSQAENNRNARKLAKATSKYKGVYFYKASCIWRAQIKINGRQIYLGQFDSEEDAHAAYCAAAKKYHGEFARTE